MLVLASASPRRQELLRNAGIPFTVYPANIPELPPPGENPRDCAERLAREKALAVSLQHPADFVLGADTIVVVDGEILGKPRDEADAREDGWKCVCSGGPRFLQDRTCRPAADSVPRSAWYQDGERESEDRPACCPGRPQGDHGGLQAYPGPFGRGRSRRRRVAGGACRGGVRPGWTHSAYPWRRSGRGRRSATATVQGVPKAPGRLSVQGDNHGGTNTTVARTWACACAWNVGAYIRRILS